MALLEIFATIIAILILIWFIIVLAMIIIDYYLSRTLKKDRDESRTERLKMLKDGLKNAGLVEKTDGIYTRAHN